MTGQILVVDTFHPSGRDDDGRRFRPLTRMWLRCKACGTTSPARVAEHSGDEFTRGMVYAAGLPCRCGVAS